MRTRRTRKQAAPATDAVETCRRLLGVSVTVIGSPGERRRPAVRVRSPERDLIVSRRASSERARLEAVVLRALHGRGAPVPQVFAQEGPVLIQEDLGSLRLSEAIAEGVDVDTWLDAALESLLRIHRAGQAAGLEQVVASIGESRTWCLELASMPARLSKRLRLSTPPIDAELFADRLQVRSPALIKWDARPGNAVARPDGTVAWFDWEHCGVRNRLDDLAWLLGDEYVGDHPGTERLLLNGHLAEFVEDRNCDAAIEYLSLFGVLHICVRLGLVLHYKADGPWWNRDLCLTRDKVGVRPEWADALCAKGARWAARAPLTEGLAPWFLAVRQRISAL